MTDSLHDRLLAAVSARRALAEAAAKLCGCHDAMPTWVFRDDENDGRIVIVDDPHPGVAKRLTRRWNQSYQDMFIARHIAANDPAQIRRDTAAHAEILKRHTAWRTPEGIVTDLRAGRCAWCDRKWPCVDWRAVATIYPEVQP